MIRTALRTTWATLATAFGREHPRGYLEQEAQQLSQAISRRVIKWGLTIGAIFAVAPVLAQHLDAVAYAVVAGATAAHSGYVWVFMPGPEGIAPRFGYLAPWGLLLAAILLVQSARIRLIIHAFDERLQPMSPTRVHAHQRSNAIRETKLAQERVKVVLKHTVMCLFVLVSFPLGLTISSAVGGVEAISQHAVMASLCVTVIYLALAVLATYFSDGVVDKVVMGLLPKSMRHFNDNPDQMLASLCTDIDHQFEGQE